MIDAVGLGLRWTLVLTVGVGTAGCVNDYLYGEGDATSTTSGGSVESGTATTRGASTSGTAEGTTGTTASSSEEGGTGSSSEGSGTVASGPGDTPGSAEGDSAESDGSQSLELCQGPCGADDDCTRTALCVELTRGAEPVCLRACGEGCPKGYTCTERTSVDGASSMQCQPNGNECPSQG